MTLPQRHPGGSARDAAIEKHMGLVRQIAAKLARQLRLVDYNDLVGDGVFGLMRAVEQFDPSRGVKFETYAAPVIRGSMLNGLRTMDWMPERKRIQSRELQRAREKFQVIHGRDATEEELAQELQKSAKEVYELVADLETSYLLSLDQPAAPNGEDERSVLETLEDKSLREPAREVEFEEEQKFLEGALANLEEKERQLISMYYFESKSFEEIAAAMNLSKQRISQIHAKAIRKLRETLHAGTEEAVGTLLEGAFLP